MGLSLFVLAFIFLLPNPFSAQEHASESGAEKTLSPKGLGLSDPTEFEAFLDGIMAAQLETNHIAGATVSVVKDGKLFLAKGYGYADVNNKKPVMTDKTLFHPGSVSKLFTWTAVMQLVERGRLDLNADVNTYLKDFKIPSTFPAPIRLAHLMSHTAGFEDIIPLYARTPKDLIPLGEFLKEKMPARAFPPGQFEAYSNYGTALAGYIVEQVSGVPFEDFIEQNIFKPLGMERSTFRQPLPPHLEGNMSNGYTFERGLYRSGFYELISGMAPAGALSATATDMARFMIAHLQDGRYGENRILREETARLMHARLFSHDPRINGNAHGFWEQSFNGLKMIEHSGDTAHFYSLLRLIPEKNVGFFVSYNSVGGSGNAREELFQAFLNRYYPGPGVAELKPSADFKNRARKFVGSYELNRRSFTKYSKIFSLMMTAKISVTPMDTLFLSLPMGLGEKQWVEVEPDFFREVGGEQTLLFREDKRGRVTHAFLGQWPEVACVKLNWYQTSLFSYFLSGICLVLFLSAALGWPAGALFRKICGRRNRGNDAPRAPRWIASLMGASFVLFVLGFIGVIGDQAAFRYGTPPLLKIILAFPAIAAVLWVGVSIFTFIAWRKKYWTRCSRFHYTLILVSALVFFWFLNFWNLLGWKL